MIRGQTNQVAAGQVISLNGTPFPGPVTVYVTVDGGTQAIGTVGGGLCAAEGNGLFTYRPSAAETDGASVSFTFTGAGAVPATTTYDTLTPAQYRALQAAPPAPPGTRTYRDLIQAALQDLQIVGAGDTLSADDAQLGVERLNDWIDALALEGLTMPAVLQGSWPLVPGLTSYEIGDGLTGPGQIDRPKPVSPQAILNIGYFDMTVTPQSLIFFGGVLTNQTLSVMPQLTVTGPAPTSFYYTPTTGPTGRLFPFPVPMLPTLWGVIYLNDLLREVRLTDPVQLPAGYRRFFRSNLTVELAAAFEKPVPVAIARIAAESMARVKTANLRMSDLGFDPVIPGVHARGYDIRTDG
jgi:hypothetical protein